MENGEGDSPSAVQRRRFRYTPPESPPPVERRRLTNYVPPTEVSGQNDTSDQPEQNTRAVEMLRAEFGDRTAAAAQIRAEHLVGDLKDNGLSDGQIRAVLQSIRLNIGVDGAQAVGEPSPFIGDNNQEKGKGELITVQTWTQGVVNMAKSMLENQTR